ncbi:MAG TPA: hypothetical protein VES97_02680, partial [Solirubrobacteraceae bacterium]|nr:hypothetical protein [Solirubrobacteraceae bacterium]
KKAKAEGTGYSNSNCTTGVESGAKFEWAPGPGTNNKFTSVERFVFSSKYKLCLSARGEEEIANKDIEEAVKAEEKGETARAEQLRREASEHQSVAEELRAKAKLTKEGCEKLIEEEKAKAPAELQTVSGTTVACGGVTSEGEYSGTKTIANLITTFTDCATSGFKCTSAGAEAGEIVTSTQDGELGVIKKELTKSKVGLDLSPATGTVEAEFTCGIAGFEVPVVVTGSVIHEVKPNTMVLTENETFTQSKGKQKPEKFEGLPADVLESSIAGGANEQSGLTLRGLLTNEEKIEVNTVV